MGAARRPARSLPAVPVAEDARPEPGEIAMRVFKRDQHELATLPLTVAVVVLIVTPMVLEAPNSLAPLATVVVAVGCVGALLGGQGGR